MLNAGNFARQDRKDRQRTDCLDGVDLSTLKTRRDIRKAMATGARNRGPLDRLNERLSGFGVTLHPTKGYRLISARRSLAAIAVAEIKSGRAPGSWSSQGMKEVFRAA